MLCCSGVRSWPKVTSTYRPSDWRHASLTFVRRLITTLWGDKPLLKTSHYRKSWKVRVADTASSYSRIAPFTEKMVFMEEFPGEGFTPLTIVFDP
jgi:hypothetical protein